MKKIPSIFIRSETDRSLVTETPNPECAWVFAGEGKATRKFDGSCCMIRGGKLFKRYDAKKGKAPPADFEPAQEPDPITGHHPGWVPVRDVPEDKYFQEAFLSSSQLDGTYELCGPKVQQNPERFNSHVLVLHGNTTEDVEDRTFEGLKKYLANRQIEGIVFHHRDGRMAKIKKCDFGMSRGTAT